MSPGKNLGKAVSRQRPTEATRNRVTLAPMTPSDLDAVIAIEQTAYSHPWTWLLYTSSSPRDQG